MNARPGLYREAGQQPGVMKSPATETADQRVFAERVRMLYSGIGLVAAVTLVNGLILAILQRDIVGLPVAAGWFAFLAASIAWRASVVAMFRRADPPPADMPRWARRYVVGAGFTGLAWGTAGIFLLPEESLTHQVFTAFVLGGMSAGAMSTLSRVHAAYVAYVVPALVPMTVHFALHGGEIGYALAGMAAFMLTYLVYVGGIQSTVLDRSLRLAFENDELVRDLTEQTGKADRLNASLRREIEERRRIETDLREREASLENAQRIAGLGSWEWDMTDDTIRGSPESYRIFSVDRSEPYITFDRFMEMVHPDDREALLQAVSEAVERRGPYSFEHRAILADGVERVVHQRGEVTLDEAGRPLAMRGTSHDVTEQHLIRREMEAAKAQAEAANRAKSRFLANMSHEFRTPLNAIIGYSEILREDAQEAGMDRCVPDIDRINRAGRHLLTLINEVLDFSKIEAGKAGLFLETFDVRALADDVISTVEPIMRENGNRLGLDCPAEIGSMCADATKVRQILFNLLSNAAKFTENGDIGVTVRRLEEEDGAETGGWLILTVQDTGIGMERDRVEAAFSAFDQLDASTTRRYGGTGLGLAITRHYCELMGGAISVESAPGEGSRFTVRLPLNVVPPDVQHA